MKFAYMLLAALILVLSVSFVAAADAVSYDFDEVNVLYAAQFYATPISGVDHSVTWVTDIIGGNPDKKIMVTYGVIELKKNGSVLGKEEFIKISGDGGSKRFLRNSGSWQYWEGTTTPSEIFSQFWSAKQLQGTSIVKDFSGTIDSVVFERKNPNPQNPAEGSTSFLLGFAQGSKQENIDFQSSPIMMFANTGVPEETGDNTATAD